MKQKSKTELGRVRTSIHRMKKPPRAHYGKNWGKFPGPIDSTLQTCRSQLKWASGNTCCVIQGGLEILKSCNSSNQGAELKYTLGVRNPSILIKTRGMIYGDNVFISFFHFLNRGLFKMLLTPKIKKKKKKKKKKNQPEMPNKTPRFHNRGMTFETCSSKPQGFN